jgi:hypothetical protein
MATLLTPHRCLQMIRCPPGRAPLRRGRRRRTRKMHKSVGLERPKRDVPMGSSAPSKRSKVAILLRKMSGQSGSPNRSRTPEALPASASLSLISAEQDGHSAGATSLPVDDSQTTVGSRCVGAEGEHAQGRRHDDLPNLAELSNTLRTRVRKALVQNQRAH